MEISPQDLFDLIKRAVEAGLQASKRDTNAKKDFVKKTDAKRFLVEKGLNPSLLDAWTRLGLLKPVKSSDAKSASAWYSLTDIKVALATNKLKQICNDN